MVDILANRVEICFGSFTVTLTTLEVATSPTVSMKAPDTLVAALVPIRSRRSTRPNHMTLFREWRDSSA
jgi:hypothetical protein